MGKEITPDFINDIERKFTLELNSDTTPLFIFSKTKMENGERFDLNFFQNEFLFDEEITAHQRELLEMFIELANEILSGNIKPRVQYPIIEDVKIFPVR